MYAVADNPDSNDLQGYNPRFWIRIRHVQIFYNLSLSKKKKKKKKEKNPCLRPLLAYKLSGILLIYLLKDEIDSEFKPI